MRWSSWEHTGATQVTLAKDTTAKAVTLRAKESCIPACLVRLPVDRVVVRGVETTTSSAGAGALGRVRPFRATSTPPLWVVPLRQARGYPRAGSSGSSSAAGGGSLGLGAVALVSLAEAGEVALANRNLARSGGDPLADKRRVHDVPTLTVAGRIRPAMTRTEPARAASHPQDRSAAQEVRSTSTRR